jgi:hypothetical protein
MKQNLYNILKVMKASKLRGHRKFCVISLKHLPYWQE